MGDIPDFTADDSYRRATEFAVKDDNLTATGQAKSYRKTPYTSRIAGMSSYLSQWAAENLFWLIERKKFFF